MEYVLLELKILYDNPNNRGIPKPLANLLSLRGIMAGTDGYSVLLLSRERYNERHLLKKKKKKRKPTPCIAVDLCVFPTFYAIPSLSFALVAFPLFTCIRPALFDRPILHSPTPIPIISRSFKRAPMTAIDVLTSIRVKKYICAISVD